MGHGNSIVRCLRESAGSLFVVFALSAAVSGEALAQGTIPGTPTTITSIADRMISYRSQNHMWQTADGATHVMINRGALMGGASLMPYSSFDGGKTWVSSGVSLPGSNGSSTSDGYLAGNQLRVTFDTGTSVIRYAELAYDAASRSWSLVDSEIVYRSSTAAALTPAMAADALGRQWLTFTHQDKATGNFSIKLMRKTAPDKRWVDTGLVFGPVDSEANERSGRPIAIAGGVGMIFTVKADMYWAERSDASGLGATWQQSLVFTKATPASDPYGTHFSVIADAASNVHVISTDGGRVVYSRMLSDDRIWSSRALTDAIKATYVQATISGSELVLVSNSYTNVSVLQSSDGGDTFRRTYALTHAPGTETISYDRPRVETPGHSMSPMPVLQQYQDGSIQRALFFAVPIEPAAVAR